MTQGLKTGAAGGEKDRITDVDALRGFALLGILIVNIGAFASPYYGLGVADPAFASSLDQAVRFAVAGLFETKFYLLFSFLFGYSFTLQMRSAERAGEAFVPRLLRRQAGLWVIGIAHAILLYHGDILTTYAVLGVGLLMLRGLNDGQALRMAVWLTLGTALLWGGVTLLQLLDPAPVNRAALLTEAAATRAAYVGAPAGIIGQHLREQSNVWVITGLMQAPCALAMFLVGLVAGRRKIFVQAETYSPLLRRIALCGLSIGLPAAVLYGWASVYLVGSPIDLFGLALSLATAPLLAGAYAAAILLLFQTSIGRVLSDLLAPTGRMALTNYLVQSAICAFVFLGYGLGLMGRVSPLVAAGMAFLIFALQLGASWLWMRRFAYGPAEWLLRAVTIAALPAWRRHQH